MKSYYIKVRINPQTGTYYVAEGQLTKKDAKKRCNAIYGNNIMLEYATREAYEKAIESLQEKGEKVY
jgi:hypothetical protein